MRSLAFLCLALVGTATAAYGQQGQQASVRVNGGTIVGQYVPDGQGQAAPMPDPAFQQPVYQGQQQAPFQGHQHSGGCGCPVCRREVVSQKSKTVEQSFTVRTYTTVNETVVKEFHPERVTHNNPQPQCPPPQRNPCPPQDPCAQPRNSGGGLVPWNQGFVGYRQQQCAPRGGFGPAPQATRPIVGFGVNIFGVGGSVAITKSSGYVPPAYAQSGYSVGGNHPWYGR